MHAYIHVVGEFERLFLSQKPHTHTVPNLLDWADSWLDTYLGEYGSEGVCFMHEGRGYG